MNGPLLLTIDAALEAGSAALFQGARLIAARFAPMGAGGGERLAGLGAEALAEAGAAPGDVGFVIATVGPGGFVGARLGPSFARGFALATGARALGATTLEALAEGHAGAVLVALDAKREGLYLQAFIDGRPLAPPSEAPLAACAAAAPPGGFSLIGSGAELWLAAAPAEAAARALRLQADAVAPESLARIALRRIASGESGPPPAPLYLRPPDAKIPA